MNTVVVGMMDTPLVSQRLTKQLGVSSAEELSGQAAVR